MFNEGQFYNPNKQRAGEALQQLKYLTAQLALPPPEGLNMAKISVLRSMSRTSKLVKPTMLITATKMKTAAKSEAAYAGYSNP